MEGHVVSYDHKRGLWVCIAPECDYQILPAKLDELYGRSISLDSGHSMLVPKNDT